MAAETRTPVFVDDTGRRHRLVRGVGWLVGSLVMAYLALLAVTLSGGPQIVPLASIALPHPRPTAPVTRPIQPQQPPPLVSPSELIATPSLSAATPSPPPSSSGGVVTPRVVTAPTAPSALRSTESSATADRIPSVAPTAQPTAQATSQPTTDAAPQLLLRPRPRSILTPMPSPTDGPNR